MDLSELFRQHPGYTLLSKPKLLQSLKSKGIKVPIKEVDEYYRSKELHEIYTPVKRKSIKFFKVAARPYSFQIDVVIMGGSGRKVLMLVDITSKKLFAYPLKSGSMEHVMDAYKVFVEKDAGHNVASVSGDAFFSARQFKEYNASKAIQINTTIAKADHSTRVGDKLAVINRCVRTCKKLYQKFLMEHPSIPWKDAMRDVVILYNDTSHSTLEGRIPDQVYEDITFCINLYEKARKHNKEMRLQAMQKFEKGTRVRLLVSKSAFNKEHPPYSREVYKVDSMEGYKFKVMDEHSRVLNRKYAPYEMIITNVDENNGDRAFTRTTSRTKKDRKRVQALVSVSKEGIARNAHQAKKIIKRGSKVDVKVAAKSRAIAKGPVKRKPYYEVTTCQAHAYCLRDKTSNGKNKEWWKVNEGLRKK